MRVLLIPEIYRQEQASACGTLNDAVTWVEEWLDRDPHIHVYWLLPPREVGGYEAGDVYAHHDRVTLLEASPLAGPDRPLLTEDGYSLEELETLKNGIFEPGAYIDVVVDQRRTGRATLSKWLLARTDHWAADVDPFDLVANVHDLQVPRKFRWCNHRDDYQMHHQLCAAAFADGIWFTAAVDRRRFRQHARGVLRQPVLERVLDRSVTIGSPIQFDAFHTTFDDRPTWLHVASSPWPKKHLETVLDLAGELQAAYGIHTVLTSPEPLPDSYQERSCVEAHPAADRSTYEEALARGDLTIVASEYETMARTPFEQAASGQVPVFRNEPWIDACVPTDFRLACPADELRSHARWAVEQWEEAVAETRHLLDHVREIRGPEAVGRRTYDDLSQRVATKRQQFADQRTRSIVAAALDQLADPVSLEVLLTETAAHTTTGLPLPETDGGAYTDVIYALRSLGYADRGNPGTPVFEHVGPSGDLPTATRHPQEASPSTSDR